jgi:hypothetical protein
VNDPQKLDYETPQPKPGFRWPPDWRRRLLIAAIAAPIVLFLTLEAARRAQSTAVSYMEGGMVNYSVLEMQKGVDDYTRATGNAPNKLTDVPEIQNRAATDPRFLTDPWGTPYLLKSINGKPIVMSYGRDKLPGGKGLDADVTANSLYGRDLVTTDQFIHHTNLTPVIFICVGNALLVTILAFAGTTDTRDPRGLRAVLLRLGITAIIALVVATLIAAVHAPSGH